MQKHFHPANLPIGNYFDLGVDLSNPPFLKGHSQDFFNQYSDHKEDRNLPLILVIRDFKECLPRHLKSYRGIMTFLKQEKKYNFHFCENIRYFLKWDPSKRFLIYYEDLMTSPEKVIRNLGEFLMADPNVVEDFIENYQEHKMTSIKFYDTYLSSLTKGEKLNFHVHKLKKNQVKEITRLIQTSCPEGHEILQRYYE